MKKISILHIDYDDLSNTFGSGGQAIVTNELYKRFPKNYSITVLTGNYPGAKNKIRHGLNYKRIGFGNFGSYISLLSFWIMVPFYVLNMQKNYDIIIEFFTAPFSASLSMFMVNKPYIAATTFLGARELSKKYFIPFYLIEDFALRNLKQFIVPIEVIKRRIKRINPSAIVNILPNGFDATILKSKSEEKQYALYIGRIDIYQKGLDTLIEGWEKVHKDYPKIKLVIAGNGKKNDETKLRKMIKERNLEENILLTGRIVGRKKIKMLAESLFIIVPSKFETFCMSALEALAVGKPLVRTHIDGMSWIPKQCSVTFASGNNTALYKKCIEVISHRNLRKKLSAYGRDFAKKFSWDLIAKKLQTIIINYLSSYHEK